MFNILNWLARRQVKQCEKENPAKESTNVCVLRLVDPPTVDRDDFGDKFDKVIEVTEGRDE